MFSMSKLFLKNRNILFRNFSHLNKLKGSNIIYSKLVDNNVKDTFIYSGGAIMPLIDCFYNNTINYYICTNELSLGLSGVGYAKSTGKPGVCIVTSGPGLTNMVTSLTDAQNDSTPLIVLSGQVPINSMGTLAFQECPATEITKSVTKWSYCVKDTSELGDVIDEAFYVSQNGKPGSVHIDLPKCILTNDYHPGVKKWGFNRNLENHNNNDDNFIKKIDDSAYLINNSKKPILYVGKGALNYSDQVTEIAKFCKIPVTTTLHGMGIFDECEDLSLKMVGMHGSMAANLSIQESDLVIAVGSRFDDRTTGLTSKYAPNAKIIHINIDNREKDKVFKSDVFFNNDVGFVLKHLRPLLYKDISSEEWLTSLEEKKNKYPFDYDNSFTMKTQDVLKELNLHLLEKDDYFVTTGVGNHQMMACQYINWRKPRSILSSGSLGVMGAGLPYAIGCQIANPNSLVIDIDGDGSFNMTGMELSTVKRYNLPIKIFIMNNKKQDMVRVWEDLFFEKRFTATDLPSNPDYCMMANSFGIKSISCKNKKDISKTIEYALSFEGPILVDFITETDYCLPLVAPGKSLDETFNYQDKNLPNDRTTFKNILPPN